MKYICLIVLPPDFMTKICKKAAQHFHCAESKVFTIEKSVALWSANIKKPKQDKDLKSYGSAASYLVIQCYTYVCFSSIVIIESH
jgi:hypothetical protein